MIEVKIPATSANLGSGFDALGLALTLYNTVYMEEWDGADIASLDGVEVPAGEDNLIFATAKRLYEICGKPFRGMRIRQKNDIPMARGLGSSSACLVGGLLGANTLLGKPLGTEDLLNLSAALEGHPDNVAPALLGGLVTCAMEEGKVYSVSVPVARGVHFAALIPKAPLPTSHARSVLPQSVSRADAVYNLSRAALMTSSLFSGALENLRVATGDRLHQPYRMGLIKGSDAAFRIARELGAYGVYISGAGSTIMAIIDKQNAGFAQEIERRLMMNGVFGWTVRLLESDPSGAVALATAT
ncbi:MAG: homoserine kinase [Clostridiales bacterium]|nr:homoserine kinase [Clostridiales bacterium]